MKASAELCNVADQLTKCSYSYVIICQTLTDMDQVTYCITLSLKHWQISIKLLTVLHYLSNTERYGSSYLLYYTICQTLTDMYQVTYCYLLLLTVTYCYLLLLTVIHYRLISHLTFENSKCQHQAIANILEIKTEKENITIAKKIQISN